MLRIGIVFILMSVTVNGCRNNLLILTTKGDRAHIFHIKLAELYEMNNNRSNSDVGTANWPAAGRSGVQPPVVTGEFSLLKKFRNQF